MLYDSLYQRWAFDPEALQSSSVKFPVSDVNGAPSGGTVWEQMPSSSSVLLDDGRVLYCWHEEGDAPSSSTRCKKVYVGYAPDETTFCTTNQSVPWADRRPIFECITTDYSCVVASVSATDSALYLMVASDARHSNLEVGDRTRAAPYAFKIVYHDDDDVLYGLSYGASLRIDRVWTVDRSDGSWETTHKVYVNAGASQTSLTDDVVDGTWDDVNNVMYVAIGGTTNVLATIDMSTGVATSVGGSTVTGEKGLAYDSTNTTLYGCTATTLYSVNTTTGAWTSVGGTGQTDCEAMAYDPTGDVLYGLGYDATLYTVNRSTGAWTSVGTDSNYSSATGLAWDDGAGVLYATDFAQGVLCEVNTSTGAWGTSKGSPAFQNYVTWWPGHGTFCYVSTDDGLTWAEHSPGTGLGAYSKYLRNMTWAEYNDTLYWDPPAYWDAADSNIRPYQGAADPTSAGNAWATISNRQAGLGSVCLAWNDMWLVSGIVLHRDQTVSTYNDCFPAFFFVYSDGQLNQLHPIEVTVDTDTDTYPDDYVEYTQGSDVPGDGWAPGDLLLARDTYGAREEQHIMGANLAGNHQAYAAYAVTSGASGPDGRLYRLGGASAVMYLDNTDTYFGATRGLIALLPMAKGSWDGKWLLIVEGPTNISDSGGLWKGPDSDKLVPDLASATWTRQDTTASNYNCRDIPMRFVRGAEYVWATWPETTGSARIMGIKAVTADSPCAVADPFEFPHEMMDVWWLWDTGAEYEAMAMMDRNLRAVEEALSRRAMCDVPEWPHRWGEVFASAMDGDPGWRSALEDQMVYAALWLCGTSRACRTPFTFSHRFDDVYGLKDDPAAVTELVDQMWDELRQWHVPASEDSNGLWQL